jgi:hypothetical protein
MKIASIIRSIALSLLLSFVAFGARAQSLQSTPFHYITVGSTNSTLVSGSGQNIMKWVVGSNNTGTVNWLKFYNKATAPTCGTDVPVITVMLPTNATGGGVTVIDMDDTRFTAGIGFCVTANAADNDNNAGTAGIALSLGYLGL